MVLIKFLIVIFLVFPVSASAVTWQEVADQYKAFKAAYPTCAVWMKEFTIVDGSSQSTTFKIYKRCDTRTYKQQIIYEGYPQSATYESQTLECGTGDYQGLPGEIIYVFNKSIMEDKKCDGSSTQAVCTASIGCIHNGQGLYYGVQYGSWLAKSPCYHPPTLMSIDCKTSDVLLAEFQNVETNCDTAQFTQSLTGSSYYTILDTPTSPFCLPTCTIAGELVARPDGKYNQYMIPSCYDPTTTPGQPGPVGTCSNCDAPTTDPGTTDPGTTDPGTTDPGTGTCSDGIQNGDETGIDTGGRCSAVQGGSTSGGGTTTTTTTDPGTTDPGTSEDTGLLTDIKNGIQALLDAITGFFDNKDSGNIEEPSAEMPVNTPDVGELRTKVQEGLEYQGKKTFVDIFKSHQATWSNTELMGFANSLKVNLPSALPKYSVDIPVWGSYSIDFANSQWSWAFDVARIIIILLASLQAYYIVFKVRF